MDYTNGGTCTDGSGIFKQDTDTSQENNTQVSYFTNIQWFEVPVINSIKFLNSEER